MSLLGKPAGKSLLLYESTRYHELGGGFEDGTVVLAAPAELEPPIMALALGKGYTRLNGFLTIQCSQEVFERYIAAVETDDLDAVLDMGIGLMSPENATMVFDTLYEAVRAQGQRLANRAAGNEDMDGPA